MQLPEDLLPELELRITCSCCHSILCRPKAICQQQHAVCRICLDQLLLRPDAKCPTCHCNIVDFTSACIDSNLVIEQLVTCYYAIQQHLQERGEASWSLALQKTTSALTDCTVDTIEDLSSSFIAGLEPLESQSPPADSQMGLLSKHDKHDIGPRDRGVSTSSQVDYLLPLSDSDTDLDLPEVGSFLQLSAPTDLGTPSKKQPNHTTNNVSGPVSNSALDKSALSTKTLAISTASPERGGRKRKQQAAADSSGVDSNLTVVNADDGKEEPHAKKGRASAVMPASLAKQQETTHGKTRGNKAVLASQSLADVPESVEPVGPKLCILVTGLTEAQTTRVRRTAKQAQELGLAVSVSIHSSADLLCNAAQQASKRLSNRLPPGKESQLSMFTHLLASPNKGGRTARTFKYLAGLVSGAWVVKMEWLLESVKAKKLLTESEFAIAGDTAMPHCSLFGPRQVGQLLYGYRVHAWWDGNEDKKAAHSHAELLDLIRATGAEVVEEASKACLDGGPEDEPGDGEEATDASASGMRTNGDKAIGALPAKYRQLFEIPVRKGRTILLVDSDKLAGPRSSMTAKLDAAIEQTGGACACRTKSWLFDCISANSILR